MSALGLVAGLELAEAVSDQPAVGGPDRPPIELELAEDRLAYVAVTRAKRLLVGSDAGALDYDDQSLPLEVLVGRARKRARAPP